MLPSAPTQLSPRARKAGTSSQEEVSPHSPSTSVQLRPGPAPCPNQELLLLPLLAPCIGASPTPKTQLRLRQQLSPKPFPAKGWDDLKCLRLIWLPLAILQLGATKRPQIHPQNYQHFPGTKAESVLEYHR